VENWLPEGVDPHEFQFSPRDVKRLQDADLLVVGGMGLERWTEEQLRRVSGSERLRVVELGAEIPPEVWVYEACTHEGHDHDHHHAEGPNPHFWLDPLLMLQGVTNVVEALVAIDPAGAVVYRKNGDALGTRLRALHGEYERGLRDLQKVPFITQHSAYPYLARRYGLRLIGVVEASAADEPSARELAGLSALVRQEGVRVLFTDDPPGRLSRRLSKDLRLRLAILDTLETGPLTPSAYEDGMRRNLEVLRRELGSGIP
jgi:zinc/manganese transport system substrate-binding protein